MNSELQTIYISCVWSYHNQLFTVGHYNLVPLIFGTTIPTSFNILMKCFLHFSYYRTDGPSLGYDIYIYIYTFTYFLCHVGIPVLCRQLLPPHFPTHCPHKNGSKMSYLYMEIQCRILMTSQLRIHPTIEGRTCFSYSFVLYDNRNTDAQIITSKTYLTILEYLGQSRETKLTVSTSRVWATSPACTH